MPCPTRKEAWTLLQSEVKNERLIKHALAVEAAMAAYAAHFGEDRTLYRLAGLLHDLDYERTPDAAEHGRRAAALLTEQGYPAAVLAAVREHNSHLGLSPSSRLSWALRAVDELCGFIVAVALVRPDKALRSVEVESIAKRMKEKAFARQVNREEIVAGASSLGVPLEEHLQRVLRAMQEIAPQLGL
jgi:putative nucleotidyltransferase with HDIG domain